MAITKIDMVNMLYNKLNISKKESLQIIDNFFDLLKAELEKSNPIKISGFAQWTVRSKRERRGRNPQTGEEMTIAARKVVTLKGSQYLIKAMNSTP